MSCWPPKGVFAQRLAALNQLTTKACTLYGGDEATWGRIIRSTCPAYSSYGDAGQSNSVIPVNEGGPPGFHLANSIASYVCNVYTPESYKHAIWTGNDFGAKHGSHYGDIWAYWQWQNAYPLLDKYYMLKDSEEPTPENVDQQCTWEPPLVYSGHHFDDMWAIRIPTDNEWCIERTAPNANRVGSIVTADDDHATAVTGYLEIYSSSPIHPDLLAHCPQGTTILGAWGKVTIGNMSIISTSASGENTTHENPDGTLGWDAGTFSTTDTTDTSGTIAFAMIGYKATGDFDFIVGGNLDTDSLESGVAKWVDLTNVFQAAFAAGVWNGPYTSIHLIPAPDQMQQALVAAGDGNLARLMPEIDDGATVDQDTGRPSVYHYTIPATGTCKLITFDSFTISDLHIAVQLPDGTVDRFMAYGTIPRLDQ